MSEKQKKNANGVAVVATDSPKSSPKKSPRRSPKKNPSIVESTTSDKSKLVVNVEEVEVGFN